MLYTCLSLEYSSYKIQYWRQKTIKIELLWSILLPNISFADILFCKTIISMKRFTITLTSGTEICSGYQLNLTEVVSPPLRPQNMTSTGFHSYASELGEDWFSSPSFLRLVQFRFPSIWKVPPSYFGCLNTLVCDCISRNISTHSLQVC